MVAGDHTVTASLPGYRDAVRDITIAPDGGTVSLEVVLTRVSGSLTVATVPAGVEVVVDDEALGETPPGIRDTGPSSPVLVHDLLPGQHRLRLARDCYTVYDVPFNIPEPPIDVDIGAIELQPAVATATIASAGPDALVYIDGERRGPAAGPIEGICEGRHVLDVRSPRGRFIDRRDWRAGDVVTLDATLRKAFALIDTDGGSGTLNRELANQIEEAVGDARAVMVFVPIESELGAANAAAGDSPAAPSLTPLERRTTRGAVGRAARRAGCRMAVARLGRERRLSAQSPGGRQRRAGCDLPAAVRYRVACRRGAGVEPRAAADRSRVAAGVGGRRGGGDRRRRGSRR